MIAAEERGRISIEAPSLDHQDEFLAAVRRSRELHGRFAAPPATPAKFKTYVRRCRSGDRLGHLVRTAEGELAGVINLNDIVRGAPRAGASASLGYYAFVPHAGGGHLRAGLLEVLHLAFHSYGLHRIEAKIHADNARSIALVRGLGFRTEERTPSDHERWVRTIEDGKSAIRARPSG